MPQVVYHNSELLEDVSFTRTNTQPQDMQGRTPSGLVEVQKFTGIFADLEELFDEKIAGASLSKQVSCSLSRLAGDTGELTVTSTHYREAASDAGSVGQSEDNPEYSFEFAETTESIMLHPLIADAGFSADVLSTLAYLANNPSGLGDFIWLSDGYQHQVYEYLYQHSVPQAVIDLCQKGSEMLGIRISCSASWQVAPDSPTAYDTSATIVDPPGGIPTPENRNWLHVGSGYKVQGRKVSCTKKYLLSDVGGWDPLRYPSAT